jgi:hypothetical protein
MHASLWQDERYELLALPRSPLPELRPGDLVVRRFLGDGGAAHLAMVTTGEVLAGETLAAAGVRPERPGPGRYVQVVEGGAFPHRVDDRFARRVADEHGLLRRDTVLLRLRPGPTGTPGQQGPTAAEADPVTVAGLGVAVFEAGRTFFTSGDLSFESTPASFIHHGTPPEVQFSRVVIDFSIDADHPRAGFGWQHFWFRLTFERNGYDIRNANIRLLEDRSSTMILSSFSIRFVPLANSAETDPVARIVYHIGGRWDPHGWGEYSYSGELHLAAIPGVNLKVEQERGIVRQGKSNTPVITPLPAPIKLTSREEVLFAVRSSKLDDGSIRKIRSWYEGLPPDVRRRVETGATPIRLDGYASTTGTVTFNQDLSQRGRKPSGKCSWTSRVQTRSSTSARTASWQPRRPTRSRTPSSGGPRWRPPTTASHTTPGRPGGNLHVWGSQ